MKRLHKFIQNFYRRKSCKNDDSEIHAQVPPVTYNMPPQSVSVEPDTKILICRRNEPVMLRCDVMASDPGVFNRTHSPGCKKVQAIYFLLLKGSHTVKHVCRVFFCMYLSNIVGR